MNSEVEKATKNTREKKATGDGVPEDIFKFLGEDGLRLMTVMINDKKTKARRFHLSYKDCPKEEATSFKIQRPSYMQQR